MTDEQKTKTQNELQAVIGMLRRVLRTFTENIIEEQRWEAEVPGTPAARHAYVETGRTMQVYWLGCRGLAVLSASLPGQPRVARIGCSVERDIEVRLRAAEADAYGSWTRDRTGVMRENSGFSRWVMQAIAATRPSADPAITARTRTIEVDLPAGMTRRGFDRALHAALSRWSLASRFPDRQHYTNYSMGADRMSRAIELYVGLDPRLDGDRLLGLVEDILRRHRERSGKAVSAPERVANARETKARANGRGFSRAPMTPTQVAAMRARLRYGTRRG